MRSVFFLSAISACSIAHGKLYTDPHQLPKTQYDFVIIGAGTAGNVIATRLTENSAFTVLVVEAGISNVGILADEVPFLGPTLSPDTSVTWNFTTVPQSGLDSRAIPYPRGRVLGGSSTINFEIWTRGSEDDYNRYAEVSGDEGWSWNEMLPYMKKSETLVTSTDNHNTSGQVNPAVHGTSGPVKISIPGVTTTVDTRVFNTTNELPDEFPFNLDMNSGNPIGIGRPIFLGSAMAQFADTIVLIGWTQNSVDSFGRRSSSATAYLELILSRSNLDVLIQTQVTKLVQTSSKGTPAFNKVEVAQNSSSARMIVSAKNEVILCAGSIGTPQILQLSGIGDPAVLRSAGVTPLVQLDDVGKHLTDHPFLGNQWLVNSDLTLEAVSRNETLVADLLEQWNTTGTGLFSVPGANDIGWLRLPQSTFDGSTDPSAGPTSAHFEVLPVNGFVSFVVPTPDTGFFLTMVTTVASPASRGTVTLASSDPFADPVIDPALLTDPVDLAIMVGAIKAVRTLVTAPAWDGYIIAPVPAFGNATTDAELEAYAQAFTTTVFHPVGTARMSAEGSGVGVVDASLRVKNVTGLRIVDASVFPFIPAAHPQAAVYAFAERASDLIKAAW
ncbi:Pyranose dehydrogenase 1, partial [Grifola frondosa]